MAQRPVVQRQNGFQTAIEDLTDGLSKLVRQHFELARTEVRQEVQGLRRKIGAAVAFGTLILFGYLLLNLAAVLAIGAFFDSLAAMALTALILGVVHFLVAGVGLWTIKNRLEEQEVGLPQTTDELEKDKQWLKEIRNNSPRALPAETS
jgi:uncharacterized membrane protein YqjE